MLKTPLCRHDLLFLSAEGRRLAWEYLLEPHDGDIGVWKACPQVPAIYKSQTGEYRDGWVDVGFSFPVRIRGLRQRAASRIPISEIERKLTPWEAAGSLDQLPGPVGALARGLRDITERRGWVFGIFGAAALQAVTGLPYLHSGSDLDSILDITTAEDLWSFGEALARLEQMSGVTADVELQIGAGQSLKLKELLSGQSTILVKGDDKPKLLPCCVVWEAIQNGHQKNCCNKKGNDRYGN